MTERYGQNMITEVKLFPNGIPIRSKQFSYREVWYLLVRKMIYTFKQNWILLLTQSAILINWIAFTHIQMDFDYDKHFGCLPMYGQNCPKTEQSIKSLKIVRYNILFIFLCNIMPQIIILTLTSLTFWLDLKIFMKEYKNGTY